MIIEDKNLKQVLVELCISDAFCKSSCQGGGQILSKHPRIEARGSPHVEFLEEIFKIAETQTMHMPDNLSWIIRNSPVKMAGDLKGNVLNELCKFC